MNRQMDRQMDRQMEDSWRQDRQGQIWMPPDYCHENMKIKDNVIFQFLMHIIFTNTVLSFTAVNR